MKVDEALALADEWTRGTTFYEGMGGWRVVCATLAEEVRRLRDQRPTSVPYDRELIAEMLADFCHGVELERISATFTTESMLEQARLLREADNADAERVGTGRAGDGVDDLRAEIEVLRRAVSTGISVITESCAPRGNPDIDDAGEIAAALHDMRAVLPDPLSGLRADGEGR